MNKVAAIQMSSSDDIDENLAIASQMLCEAAENGAKLVVLPEMFAIMGAKATDKVLFKEPIGVGKIQTFLAAEAKKNALWIVAGTLPMVCENKSKIRAASLVFNNQGEMLARYDKIHLFNVHLSTSETYNESNTTEPGHDVIVVDTPMGKLGLAVCYDIRFSELFGRLINKGAEIIAIPSAFTMKTGKAHWELLARSRAVENFCYIIGACQGGTHTHGRETYGHSLIVDPWGDIIAKKGDNTPGIIYATIDLDYLKKIRKSMSALNP